MYIYITMYIHLYIYTHIYIYIDAGITTVFALYQDVMNCIPGKRRLQAEN